MGAGISECGSISASWASPDVCQRGSNKVMRVMGGGGGETRAGNGLRQVYTGMGLSIEAMYFG
jgi:hypothetical protein